MRPALSHRVATAWDDLRALDTAAANQYLRELRRSDPEAARQVDALLRAEALDLAAGAAPSEQQQTETRINEANEVAEALHCRPTVPKSAEAAADAPRPPVSLFAEGQLVGRFQLLRILGRGTFGEVWQAHDPVLQKHVAVKVPRARHADNPPLLATFLPEARKAASLRHPAIVQVYDVGQTEDGWYIISEYIDGESLRERLTRDRVPFDRAARTIATVASALHRAHLAGLIHRDVKPANILLDRDGNAYLTDFGLAVSEEEQLAERRKVTGTLAYMSPEQIRGDAHLMDGRSDIYALGAVLYEVLTGRPLFRAGSLEEYRELILRREPRPLRSIDDSIPEELQRICLKCLAKEVRQRYATGQDLANDLEAWLTAAARPVAEPATRSAPVARPWKLAAAAALVLSLAGIAVGIAVLGGQGPRLTAPGGKADTASGGGPDLTPTVKKLVWPERCDVCNLGILPETNRLKVSTDSTALLQLGTTDADAWEFGATLRRLFGSGQRGLFLGYRKDPATPRATFELVRLVENGDNTFLQRSLETYRTDADAVTLEGRTYATVPLENVKSENSLRLVIRANRLREVRFNGKPVPKLFDVPLDSPAVGPFGVFNQNLEAVVSDPQFNGAPIPLRIGGRRPSTERP